MTNASELTPHLDPDDRDTTIELDPDFDLDDELEASEGWEDDPNPEDDDSTVGALDSCDP